VANIPRRAFVQPTVRPDERPHIESASTTTSGPSLPSGSGFNPVSAPQAPGIAFGRNTREAVGRVCVPPAWILTGSTGPRAISTSEARLDICLGQGTVPKPAADEVVVRLTTSSHSTPIRPPSVLVPVDPVHIRPADADPSTRLREYSARTPAGLSDDCLKACPRQRGAGVVV